MDDSSEERDWVVHIRAADGLVKRVDDPSDGRAVRAAVTSLGMDRRAEGTQAVGRLQDEVTARVAPAERAIRTGDCPH